MPQKKPAPDIYNWVLNELKLAPQDCIALEDSNNGLRSSLAAGIKTYITTNPYTCKQDFTGAAAVFDDLGDLPRFYSLIGLTRITPSHPTSSSYRRRPVSSGFIYHAIYFVPLRGGFFVDWIPACAGMTGHWIAGD